MSPDSPQDPQKGKVDEAAVPEDAKDAKETVDEAAAEQPAPKPKPKPKRARTKKAETKAEAKNPEGTKPEGTKKKAAAAATDKETQEAVAAQPRKRDRRRRAGGDSVGVLVRAQAKYVRTSARKARLVCDHIRGKDVVEARAILAYTPRAAAKPWLKLLESAIANAEHNHELVGDDLKIAAVHADEGPTLKRYRPRAMGRATRIRKRTSHLTITLTPKES
jgi:ribosomal protein L22